MTSCDLFHLWDASQKAIVPISHLIVFMFPKTFYRNSISSIRTRLKIVSDAKGSEKMDKENGCRHAKLNNIFVQTDKGHFEPRKETDPTGDRLSYRSLRIEAAST